MKFEQRSYSGQVFRPSPEILQDDDLGLFIISTPWGAKEGAKRVAETIKEYLVALRGDSDSTSPFPRVSCLSRNANNLRIAAMLANEQLYREDNKDEYVTGVELFALSLSDGEIAWIQLGHPNVFLSRTHRGLLPIGCHLDLPLDLSIGQKLLSPLPSTVMGLDPTANFLVGSFLPQKNDQLILVSRSSLSKQFFQLDESSYSIERMTKILSDDDPEVAFWLGKLSL